MRRVDSLRVAANPQELSTFAAEQFVLRAIAAQREKELFTVVLAGGATPKTLYQLLANENEPYRAQLCWEKAHFFWGDERHVPPDHPDSNYRMAFETMLARVRVPSKNIHRIKGEVGDADEAAHEYEETLVQFFRLGKGHLPSVDLVLLGMGSDGHTASIFPNSDVVNEKERLVVAPWIEKLKSYRLTLTPPVLNNAAVVIFLVSGAEKANALREVLEGDYRPECFPAQIIRPMTGKTLWLVDHEAAPLLTPTKLT